MKKVFEYLGLISLICFSFFITEQTTMVVQEVDEIMVSIKEEMSMYETMGLDAKIIDNQIIPGLVGKKVNVNKSYDNMKEKGIYDASFYIFDDVSPTISIKDNLDKYIVTGNSNKNMVSLVFLVNNKTISKIQDIVGDTPVSFVIESYNIDKEINNIISATKMNNEILIFSNNKENYQLLTNKLNSINVNTNFCYNNVQNLSFIKLCASDFKYSIYNNQVINKSPLKTVKKVLKSGSILVFEINDEVLNELPNIISYIGSRGYSIESLSNHLSENW